MDDQIDPTELLASLERANKTSELFQRKQAELEEVNDRLRMENVQLLQRVDELSHEIQSLTENLTELQRQNTNKPTLDSHLTPHNSTQHPTSHHHEVTTLRRVKKELEEQLHASKSTTLSFQASFQAEFDLRTQIEQRLDELRERYERLIMENDQLRLLLKAHNITAPSPPGLRSMPGSRKKKHAPKARPMTMYSDLSMFAGNGSRQSDKTKNNSKNKLPQLKKVSSLKSLEEEKKLKDSSAEGVSNSQHEENGETNTRVLAETAQIVLAVGKDSSTKADNGRADSSDKSKQGGCMESKEGELEREQIVNNAENGTQVNGDTIEEPTDVDKPKHEGDAGTLSPVVCSRTDTLMWNAKGFLNRIEGLAESVDSGSKVEESEETKPTSPVNDRDENELKQMMSSVSVKQLESAKAFLEASQRKSSVEDLTAD